MNVIDTIEKLLKEGQTVYVWYYNGDTSTTFYQHPYTGTALKLVPNGDGLYTRHWRNEENTDWERGDSDYDRDQNPETLNEEVHHLVFENEDAAIAECEKMKENPDHFPVEAL